MIGYSHSVGPEVPTLRTQIAMDMLKTLVRLDVEERKGVDVLAIQAVSLADALLIELGKPTASTSEESTP